MDRDTLYRVCRIALCSERSLGAARVRGGVPRGLRRSLISKLAACAVFVSLLVKYVKAIGRPEDHKRASGKRCLHVGFCERARGEPPFQLSEAPEMRII